MIISPYYPIIVARSGQVPSCPRADDQRTATSCLLCDNTKPEAVPPHPPPSLKFTFACLSVPTLAPRRLSVGTGVGAAVTGKEHARDSMSLRYDTLREYNASLHAQDDAHLYKSTPP